jgi:ubiquinone/menaquinone biosynthesis C-methylase UbiE
LDQNNKIFDDIAADYRKIHDKNIKITGENSAYFAEYKIKEIRQILNEPLTVLDLGCGDGISEVYLQKYFEHIKCYGIDISKESIKVALSRNLVKCEYLVYDGENIPFKDNIMDCVFVSGVLHHVNHAAHESLLSECRRVLAQNGTLIIFEHNPLNPITRKIVDDCIFDKDAVLVKHSKIMKTLINVGFTKLKVSFTLFFPRVKYIRNLLFIEKWLKSFPFGGQYYVVAKK